MNLNSVFYLLGWLVAGFGMYMTVPMIASWGYHNADTWAFMQVSIGCMLAGVVAALMFRQEKLKLNHRDGFLLTALAWILMGVLGALPLYLSGAAPDFVTALFESVSGVTATGASAISNLDSMGHGILLWRAMLQWLGGMGIIVFAVAVLPFLGIGGVQLFKSEIAGVNKDKLQPRISETARILWTVYASLTLACTLALWAGGMTLLDAVCHAFSTISTAGFSTHDASVAYYDSALIEGIIMVFMLLGAINFTLHFKIAAGRSLKPLWESEEVGLFLGVLLLASTFVVLTLMLHNYGSLGVSLRDGLFTTVSILTTTGFSTADFNIWPVTAPLIILMIMFMGGCSGSTSGGIKVQRALLIVKHGFREVKRLIHPHGVVHVKVDNRMVGDTTIQSVWAFVGLFTVSFLVVALILSAYDIDLVTAFSASAATITNTGPGLGNVGPTHTYGWMPNGAKLTLCFAMLLGRLELFTFLVLLNPLFWRR